MRKELAMRIPDDIRIPVTVFSLEAGFLLAVGLIFFVLAPA
jgi:hypothetical protein